MAQPPTYIRQTNFVGALVANPTAPFPVQSLDTEFNTVKTTLDATLTNLALIQRDDGALRTSVVSTALDAAVASATASQLSAASSAASAAASAVEAASAALIANPGALLVTATDSTTALTLANHTGSTLTAKQFGAVGDGVTDDTAVLQAMFNAARDAGKPWMIGPGTYKVTSVTAYTSGTCHGILTSANDSSLTNPVFTIASLTADIAAITLAEVNAYTNMVRGANKLGGLTGRDGQFVYIDTSADTLIGRIGASDLQQGDSFVVSTGGYISPPLYSTWALPLASVSAFSKTMRNPIEVSGLTVTLTGTASGERSCGIQVERPNTTLTGCKVGNTSTGTVQQGFKVQSACNVTFVNCNVDGLGVNTTNYGWQFGFACNITLLNCSENKCRRGADGQRAKNIRIVGGSFPSGVGAHYAWGYSVTGANLGANTSQNPHACHFAGGDFVVRDCDINVSYPATGAVRVRGDIFECGGKLVVSGNRIIFDDTDTTLIDDAWVVDMQGPTASYDAKRIVALPQSISITDNTVTLLGAASATNITVLQVLRSSMTFTYGATVSGNVEVSGNSFSYANGATFGGAGRSQFLFYKKSFTVGSGYKVHIADVPGTYVYSYCDAAEALTTTARHDFNVERTGDTNILSLAYGTFKHALVQSDAATYNFPGGTGAYAALGDELRMIGNAYRITDNTTYQSFMNKAGSLENFRLNDVASSVNYLSVSPSATGNALTVQAAGSDSNISTNYQTRGSGTHTFKSDFGGATQFQVGRVASAVNYVIAYGAATGVPARLAAFGTDAAVDLLLEARGTAGRVRFGTLTANADAAITGYIEIKDAAGTLRKLAIIA